MTARQYGRKVSIVVGDYDAIEFSDLRVQFHIRRGDVQTPNSCDLRIFNVSDLTANRLENEFTRVIVQAGYEGNFGLIFDGNIKQARIGRENETDTYVDITAADGDRLYNYSVISKSLAAGATPDHELDAFIEAMAAGAAESVAAANAKRSGRSIEEERRALIGYKPEFSKNGSVRGVVHYGATRDSLREFAEQNDCVWSIQDGKIVLIPKTSFIPGDIPLISPATGLVGIPEFTQNGLQIRVLLNPTIKIGQRIKLDSTVNGYRYDLSNGAQKDNIALSRSATKRNWDGLYYVMSAEHAGDTRGETFYTDLTCLAVDATVPLNIAPKAAILPEAASIRMD